MTRRPMRPMRPARAAALIAATAAALCSAGAAAAPPDFGPMETYQLAIIRRGPAWTPERNATVDSLQAGHMANIRRMADAGKLVAAGPFAVPGDLRGLYFFRTDSADAARLAAEDPAVKAGRLILELHPLMTRAGIGEPYKALKAKGDRRADSMTVRTFGFLRTAPGRDTIPAAQIAALQEPHLWHLRRGMSAGRLLLAGPLLSPGPRRGIFVFEGDTTAARAFFADDPLVRRGALEVEVLPWFASAHLIAPLPD